MSNQTSPPDCIVMKNVWSDLLFLHWTIPVECVRPLVPPTLDIDAFEGQAYIGLVPFFMTGVRPNWLPALPLAARLYENFHETNVRTYVTHNGKPGVWFFSLDAASLPAVAAARAWYKLPYFWAKMSLRHHENTIEYSSRRVSRNCGCDIVCQPAYEAAPANAGSLEHFLVERYVLYSQARGQLFRGRVQHSPYQIAPVKILSLRENLIAAAGIARDDTAPHAVYARRVEVDIYQLEQL